jgi:hypothetical protein
MFDNSTLAIGRALSRRTLLSCRTDLDAFSRHTWFVCPTLQAFETLNDPDKRASYDEHLESVSEAASRQQQQKQQQQQARQRAAGSSGGGAGAARGRRKGGKHR